LELVKDKAMYAYNFGGIRYDVGDKVKLFRWSFMHQLNLVELI
jgi:UTP-glucose-1-phosphate uridylyltransferase